MQKKTRLFYSLILSTVFFFVLAIDSAAAKDKDQIRYAHFHVTEDNRDDYTLELLRLALVKAGGTKVLVPIESNFPQSRGLQELESGNLIDIDWSITSKERESRLLPIRISLDKGLFGWRIPLVRQGNEELFQHVKTLKDLKRFSAGQGFDWPDTTIMRKAGLKVEGGWEYSNLLKMLGANRFDYFPRSVIDIEHESNEYVQHGLVVEPHLVLRYPTTFYFFVNKKNKALASYIQSGLEAALKDGSLDQLFYKYYGNVIERLNLINRQVIDIENPLLPEATPLDRTELWFRPEDFLKPKRQR